MTKIISGVGVLTAEQLKAVRGHILDSLNATDYDTKTNELALVKQIDSMRNGEENNSDLKACIRLAEGGKFLANNWEIEEFLQENSIRYTVKGDETDAFETYVKVVSAVTLDIYHSTIADMTTKQRLINAGMKEEDFSSHESDLYVRKTITSNKWIQDNYRHKDNVTIFKDEIEGKEWFELPFGYEEWTRGKMRI